MLRGRTVDVLEPDGPGIILVWSEMGGVTTGSA